MDFKSFVKITDTWPVNKFFYDMSDPADKKRYEDDLRERISQMERIQNRKVVSEEVVKEPYSITCWRGFDLRSFDRDATRIGDKFFLSGEKAMEGMLWFTHSLQPKHIRPLEYATSMAGDEGYLLTYPLECFRTYKKTKYDSGEETIDFPEGVSVSQTELSPIGSFGRMVYELPKGWYFTWQVEKHMGFKGLLPVDPEMLKSLN
jgi:hypothetical protein